MDPPQSVAFTVLACPFLAAREFNQVKLSIREESGIVVLKLDGRLVLNDGDVELRAACRQALDGGHRTMLLNLADMTYVDSAGLGEIADCFKAVSALGGRIMICEPRPTIVKLLKLTGLSKVMGVAASEAEALGALQR
jgi:anti-anti-sigma factor